MWLGIAVAQTTTLPVFQVGHTDVFTSVRASVIGVDTTATTLLLNCLPDSPATDCDIAKPMTLTEGPSTFTQSGIYVATFPDHMVTVTQTQDCKITGSVKAVCSLSHRQEVVGSGTSTSESIVTKTTFTSGEFTQGTITVTAGVEKLQQTQTSEASTQTETQNPTQASTQNPTASTGQAAERLSGKEAVSLGGVIAVALAAML